MESQLQSAEIIMRVTCSSIADFLKNLGSVVPERVFDRTVYAEVSKTPVGDAREAVKFNVDIQVSTVIEAVDGGQYLLVTGEHCGVDYEDAIAERLGTERASNLLRMLEDHCKERGIRILPGIVGE